MRDYHGLTSINGYIERFNYLKLDGNVGIETFGFDRYLNQAFYSSYEWKRLRDEIILRDNGCDLGHPDYQIHGKIYIHHMNPISKTDLLDRTELLLNPDYLICVSHKTHNAIHYGDVSLLSTGPIVRKPNDTCPWRK